MSTEISKITALRRQAAAKLAKHEREMADPANAAWLDETAGRRTLGNEITADLKEFIAKCDRDLERLRAGEDEEGTGS